MIFIYLYEINAAGVRERGLPGQPGSSGLVPRAAWAPACPGGCLPAARGGCRRSDLRYGSGEAERCPRRRAAICWQAGGCLALTASRQGSREGAGAGRLPCYGLGGDPRQVPRHRLARNDWHDWQPLLLPGRGTARLRAGCAGPCGRDRRDRSGWLHWRAGDRLEYIGGHRGGEISRR